MTPQETKQQQLAEILALAAVIPVVIVEDARH
ncbi:MAG: keto-deoxy-phosphogluconate aldolase, partial [Rhodanobacter sp.]